MSQSDPHAGIERLARALVEEMAAHLGRRLEAEAAVTATDQAGSPAWAIRVRVSGTARGVIVIGLDADAIAVAFDAPEEVEARDGAIAEGLAKLGQEALAKLRAANVVPGAAAEMGPVERLSGGPAGAAAAWAEVTIGERTFRIGSWTTVEAAEASPAGPSDADDEAEGDGDGDAGGMGAWPRNLDVILEIELPLAVRFGETEMPLFALSRLGPGSVIDLGRSLDEPVDVLVSGTRIARGEVVVVSGSYGVRITEVFTERRRSNRDVIRALHAAARVQAQGG